MSDEETIQTDRTRVPSMIFLTCSGTHTSPFSGDNAWDDGGRKILSVLCVYENPAYLDRICRYLERSGSMSVDISVSPDDALHLLRYVHFDVIVTGFVRFHAESHFFLKRIRDQNILSPFIYFTAPGPGQTPEDTGKFSPVFLLTHDDMTPDAGMDRLYSLILQVMADAGAGQAERSTAGETRERGDVP